MNVSAKNRIEMAALTGAMVLTAGLLGPAAAPVEAAPLAPAAQQSNQNQNQDPDQGEQALERAREAAEAGRWSRAVDHYREALEHMPDNDEARQGLQRALTMLNEGDIVEDVAEELELIRSRVRAEYEDFVERAEQRIAQENYSRARELVITARVRLDSGRAFLPTSEYEERAALLENMLDEIEQREREARLVEEAQQREEAEREAREERQREREQRERDIRQGLIRVRELQQEMKYREALQVIDEILFMDENNPAALALRDIIQTSRMYREMEDIERKREMSYNKLKSDNREAMIAPTEVMDYPDDWPELSLRRTGASGWTESAENRQVRQRLADNRIPVNLNENRLEDAVAYLRDATGVQIHPDWRALEAIGVHRDDRVSMNLDNVTAEAALDRILTQVGDDWSRPEFAVQDGMVVMSSETALSKHTETIVYDIRDLLFEVPYFDNAPAIDLNSAQDASVAVAGSGGSTGRSGGGRSGGGGPFAKDPGPEPDRRNREELVEQIIGIIQENVDPEGWRDLGGMTGSVQELNGNLIITNTPGSHQQIEGLLQQLREIRALQINIEARFLTVSTDWFEKIGVDLDLYFNTNRSAFDQLRAADPNAQLGDFFGQDGRLRDPVIYTTEVDEETGEFTGPAPTGNMFGIPIGDVPDDVPPNGFLPLGYAVGPVGTPVRTRSGFTPIGFVQDHFNTVDTLAGFDAATFAGQAAGANPALSFGVQFLDDVQVDLLIEATQADRRSVLLTAPRLTMFNGQRAWVAVTTSNVFVTDLEPVTGDGVGIFQPITDILNEGTVLDIEAVVSADRRYVTMTVITGVSEVSEGRTISATGAVGGGGFGGGDAATFGSEFTAPEVTASVVHTTVSVPDKGTVLLGGQRLVREIEVETGVPVLSKMPVVNRFFTNRVTSKEEESLLMLIRPEIIIQQEREDMLFPGLSDQLGGGAAFQ